MHHLFKKENGSDEWHVSDWVFAFSEEEGYWYPAEITQITDEGITVHYEADDTEELLDADSLADYSTEVGEEGAESWWEKDESYYAVNILAVQAKRVQVEYEDGVVEWTDLSNLRFSGEE